MTGYATRTGENVSLWLATDDKLWLPGSNNYLIFIVFWWQVILRRTMWDRA
jgi:hypothetical protein